MARDEAAVFRTGRRRSSLEAHQVYADGGSSSSTRTISPGRGSPSREAAHAVRSRQCALSRGVPICASRRLTSRENALRFGAAESVDRRTGSPRARSTPSLLARVLLQRGLDLQPAMAADRRAGGVSRKRRRSTTASASARTPSSVYSNHRGRAADARRTTSELGVTSVERSRRCRRFGSRCDDTYCSTTPRCLPARQELHEAALLFQDAAVREAARAGAAAVDRSDRSSARWSTFAAAILRERAPIWIKRPSNWLSGRRRVRSAPT